MEKFTLQTMKSSRSLLSSASTNLKSRTQQILQMAMASPPIYSKRKIPHQRGNSRGAKSVKPLSRALTPSKEHMNNGKLESRSTQAPPSSHADWIHRQKINAVQCNGLLQSILTWKSGLIRLSQDTLVTRLVSGLTLQSEKAMGDRTPQSDLVFKISYKSEGLRQPRWGT